MPIPNARPISWAKAKLEIQQREKVFQPISSVISVIGRLFQFREDAENFYSSPTNAFLFDRASVLRHFFKNPGELPDNLFMDNTTHLMVILGAHDSPLDDNGQPTGFIKSSPTLIIAGVKEDTSTMASTNQISVMIQDIAEPADEYPPGTTIGNKSFRENEVIIQF